ncbi:MAG: hypothetical protein AB1Y25_11125 [Cycloclasticus sp.]
MHNKIEKMKNRITRSLADKLVFRPKIKKHADITTKPHKVLIAGVVLQDRDNHYDHISSVFVGSNHHEVQQVWAVLKGEKKLKLIDGVKLIYIDVLVPRSSLINSLLEQFSDQEFDYIIIVDDDIRLPKDFLDQFLLRQEQYDFALAQPARTAESVISHQITTQNLELCARQTLFVEIGPLVSIRRDAQSLLLPLNTESPMGWGLDYVWPVLLTESNKEMGIIDCVPVAHTLRDTGGSYDSGKAMKEMRSFLSSRPHLSEMEAHTILHKYV